MVVNYSTSKLHEQKVESTRQISSTRAGEVAKTFGNRSEYLQSKKEDLPVCGY
jgi:hypothetical protein